MNERRRFAGLAVVVAIAVAAMSSCSGGGEHPATLPPVTSTAVPPITTAPPTETSDPTPTTTLTLYPEHDESVDAFVQSYFAAYNAAQDSRDLSGFEALYLPQCTGCTAMRDELAGWLVDGQTIEGGDWHILQQRSTAFDDKSKGEFDALLYMDAITVVAADGSRIFAKPVTTVQLATGGVRPDPGWKLEGFAIEDAPA